MDIEFLLSFFIYITLELSYTQKIYENIKLHYFLVSILIPFCFIVIRKFDGEDYFKVINVGLLTFYYLFFLLILKRTYKKVNAYLIKKEYIDNLHLNKDFTYVLWDSDIPLAGKWWDKARALPPSWLDTLFSYLLLILPLSLMMLIAYLINMFSQNHYIKS